MKGRWTSLVVVLVLVNYLIISTVWSAVRHNSSAPPTATRTPKPTFTAEVEARTYLTSTATPKGATRLAALTPVKGPTLAVTDTPVPPTATTLPTVRHTATSTISSPASPPPATATPSATPIIHVVTAGETLLGIAIEYEMTVDEIMQLNDLKNDLIFIGQELVIPQGTPTEAAVGTPEMTPVLPGTPVPIGTSFVHLVQAGENLAWIADRYGITVDAIVEANGLKSTDWIYVGQRLIIPAAATPTPGPTTAGRTHVVLAGENLTWIAGRYGVAIEAIMRANGITNANTIYVGQVLIIP